MERVKKIALDNMKVTKEGSVASISADDLYKTAIPDNLTVEQIEAVEKYNKEYVNGVMEAFGEKSVAVMSEDKAIDKTLGNFNFGVSRGGSLELVTERQHKYIDHLHNKEEVVKYGYTTVKAQTPYGSGAETRRIKDAISKMAEEAFSKMK